MIVIGLSHHRHERDREVELKLSISTARVSVLEVNNLVSAKGWQRGLACGGVRTLFSSWPRR